MPSSSARATARSWSAGSPLTISPPTAPQPKPSSETSRPVLPNLRFSTHPSRAAWLSPDKIVPERGLSTDGPLRQGPGSAETAPCIDAKSRPCCACGDYRKLHPKLRLLLLQRICSKHSRRG